MATRRNTRSRRQRGGMAELTTVEAPSLANAQGNAFRQQGGQAPVGDQGLLEGGLRSSAGLDTLDAATSEIKGMQDGGRRRRRNTRRSTRRNRKASKKNRKNRRSTRRNRRGSRRNRRYRGGAMPAMNPGSTSAGGMLLPSSVTASGMNPEWRLAENPRAFAP